MACDVRITLNDGSYITWKNFVDFSYSPIEEIAKVLFEDNKKRQELSSKFTKFYSSSNIGDSQIGNISYSKLREQIPIRGGWPEYDLEGKGTYILYIDQNKGHGLPKPYKVRVNKDGEPDKFVTIQPIYKSSLNAFRNHLVVTQMVDSLDDTIKFSPEFTKLTEGKSLQEIKDIFKTYLEENSYTGEETFKYKNKVLDSETVIQDEILGLSGRIKNRIYKNEVFNYLKSNLEVVDSTKRRYGIQFGNFVEALERLNTDKKLDEKIQSLRNMQQSETATIKEIVDLTSDIIDTLKQKDPEFPYIVSILKDGVLQFNLISKTINEKYGGITYSDIQKQYIFKEDYKGFDIYYRDGRFYVTKGPMTGESNVIPYSSIEDARKSVDYNIMGSKQTLSYYLNRRFKDEVDKTYITSTKKFEKDQIIKSLDYKLPSKTVTGELATLLNNRTYKDFVNYINSTYDSPLKEHILETVNTPEKAGVFIYMLANNESNIYNILSSIAQSGYRYFYVMQGDTPYNLRIKEITEDSFKTLRDEYKEAPKLTQAIPTAEFINSLVKAIQNKLQGTGFTIELLTSDEIKKKYPKSDLNAKAFVSGDKIIINASTADILTPLHEYAHIFLGMLKARNFNKYRQLIDNALNTYKNQDVLAKLRARKEEQYPDYTEYDIDEELFADMFSRYIIDNTDYTEIDNEVKKEVLQSLDALNEFSKRFNLANLWKSPISIFSDYNSDVMIDLDESDDRNVHKVYRQATNWIRQQIHDKKIKENCK